jgi:hypothetical protein
MKRRRSRIWGEVASKKSEGIIENFSLELGWILTYRVRGEANVRTTNLEFLQPYGRLGEVLRDAYFDKAMQAANNGARLSMINLRSELKVFAEYIQWCIDNKFISEKPTATHLEVRLVRGYTAWLVKTSERKMSAMTIFNHFKSAQTILKCAVELHRCEFPVNYAIPSNPVSRLRANLSSAENVVIYDTQKIEGIKKAAARHIAYVMGQNEIPGPPKSMKELYPFFVFLVAALVANPGSLAGIRRDCLKPHPVMPDSWVISWFKARSSGFQDWTVTQLADKLNPVAVIRFLLKWTEPLVLLATAPINQYLFIYDIHGVGIASSLGRIQRLTSGAACYSKEKLYEPVNKTFADENGIDVFRLATLRESQVVQGYLNDGNARRVKELLGHKRWATVQIYLKSRLAKIKQAEVFGNVFDAVDASLRTSTKPSVVDSTLKDAVEILNLAGETREKNLSGEYDAGTNGCKNPYKSPMPGQQEGKLCQLWHACLRCKNAFVTIDHLPMVILRKRTLEKRREIARNETWDGSLDAKALPAITKIVERFSPETIKEAEALANALGDFDIVSMARQRIVF